MMKKTPLFLMAGTLLALTAPVAAQDGQSSDASLSGTVQASCTMYVDLGGDQLNVLPLVTGSPVTFSLDIVCNHYTGAGLSITSSNKGLAGPSGVIPYGISVDGGYIDGNSSSGASGVLLHSDYDLLGVGDGTFIYVELTNDDPSPYAGTYGDLLTINLSAGT